MCGIAGYIGDNDKTEEVLSILEKLEYRGSDSCGIGFVYTLDNKFYIEKALNLSNLKQNAKILPSTISKAIIGHTRWSSTGPATLKNAHPIKHGIAMVVHNGTIENYKEIKGMIPEYYRKSYNSDTDSEVIAALFGYYYDVRNGTDVLFSQVNNALKGNYAYAVILQTLPNQIFISSKGLPLYFTESGYLSSDVNSLKEKDDNYLTLEDGDSAVLHYTVRKTKTSKPIWYEAYNKNFRRINLQHTTSVYDAKSIKKENNNGEDKMLQEIKEQPELIRKFKGECFNSFPSNMVIFGCGSSYYAGLLGRKYFHDLALCPTYVEYSSEFSYCNLLNENVRYVAISQSAETVDTTQVMERLPKNKMYLITNNPTGRANKFATSSYNINAGPEHAVAATKSFTLQSLALLYLAGGSHISLIEKSKDLLANSIETVIKTVAPIKKVASCIKDYHHILCLARNYNYPIALEAALKLKEVSGIHSEALVSSEIKHGPISLINKDVLSIFIISHEGNDLGKILGNLEQIKARNGKILVVCDSVLYPSLHNNVDYILDVPYIDKLVQPLAINVVFQLLSYYIAKEKGLNADNPPNLCKAVCVN